MCRNAWHPAKIHPRDWVGRARRGRYTVLLCNLWVPRVPIVFVLRVAIANIRRKSGLAGVDWTAVKNLLWAANIKEEVIRLGVRSGKTVQLKEAATHETENTSLSSLTNIGRCYKAKWAQRNNFYILLLYENFEIFLSHKAFWYSAQPSSWSCHTGIFKISYLPWYIV